MFSCNIIAHKCAYILIERQGKESCAKKSHTEHRPQKQSGFVFLSPTAQRWGRCVGFFRLASLDDFLPLFSRPRAVSYFCFFCFFARPRAVWFDSFSFSCLQLIFLIFLLGLFSGLFGHFSGLWDIFPVLSTGRYLLSTGYIYILSVHFI